MLACFLAWLSKMSIKEHLDFFESLKHGISDYNSYLAVKDQLTGSGQLVFDDLTVFIVDRQVTKVVETTRRTLTDDDYIVTTTTNYADGVRHGTEETITETAQTRAPISREVTEWKHGIKDGPYFRDNERSEVRGQYHKDRKEGRWERLSKQDMSIHYQHYLNGIKYNKEKDRKLIKTYQA